MVFEQNEGEWKGPQSIHPSTFSLNLFILHIFTFFMPSSC